AMTAQRLDDLPGGWGEHPRRPVRRAREDRLAIGADREREDRAGVARNHAPENRAVARTPEPDRGIIAGREDRLAVRRDHDPPERSLVTLQDRCLRLDGRGIPLRLGSGSGWGRRQGPEPPGAILGDRDKLDAAGRDGP